MDAKQGQKTPDLVRILKRNGIAVKGAGVSRTPFGGNEAPTGMRQAENNTQNSSMFYSEIGNLETVRSNE